MVSMLSGKRFINDITSVEGQKKIFLTSTFGHHLIINELTHAMKTSFSILIVTSQPNLVIDSGIHFALHTSCHDQITYTKFNGNIVYPLLN